MRILIAFALAALAFNGSIASAPAPQAAAAFAGQWNITGTGDNAGVVYWLEVKRENGAVKGRFLNRFSSPYDLANIKVENGELAFWNTPRAPQTQPSPVWRAKVVDGKLVGTTTTIRRDGEPAVIEWVGVRPPTWPAGLNANGAHTYGAPIAVFDGTLDAWGVQHKQNPMNWSIVDGAMTSAEKAGNNLVSKQIFRDFKIEAVYAIAPKSNGGIYVRGRYELQLIDDAGEPVTPQSHMAIYGRTPPAVNASKPADEWQTMEAIVVGNRVTVTLNGQRVHDNAVIEGITGGALDANETEPGPLMLQGDHGKVSFRKVVVTPITRAGS
jgi:hypothetical protein